MSGNLTQSAYTTIQYLDNVYVQFIFTGTPVGTFQVQVSNNGTSWDPITFSTQPVASGAAGTVSLNLRALGAPYIRVAYVATSGTGTLDAYISGKQT